MTSIQSATWRDIRAVYHLEREIFPQDAYPYLDLSLLFLIPGIVTLKVVNAEGALVAFGCGSRSWLRCRPAWIITLGVAHAYQRQGIGGELLLACEARLNRQRVRLTVRENNSPAIRLYEQCGYVPIKVHYYYYPDGENGVVMEKARY